MKPVVSKHAIERFIERVAPAADPEQARAAIEGAIPHAVKMPTRFRGASKWRSIDPPCVLVIDADRRNGRLATVITVLPLWQSDEEPTSSGPSKAAG